MRRDGPKSRSGTVRSALLMLAATAALLVLAPAGGGTRAGEEGATETPPAQPLELSVTIYKVWASGGEAPAKGSDAETEKKDREKGLAKFARRLRKCSKKSSFRLDEKPLTGTLTAGKALTIKLPRGYELRLTIEKDKEGKPAILQVLVNPKKEESANLLKRSPVVTQIEKIREGEETFLVLVEFGPRPEKR